MLLNSLKYNPTSFIVTNNNHSIFIINTTKYLGVLFDNKLI